jgi:hypothetical protein
MRSGLVALLVLGAVVHVAGAAPRLALLATRANEPESTLVWVEPGAHELPAAVARIDHLPGATVRGAVHPDGKTVLVVADRSPGPDRSWGSSLLRVVAAQPTVELCDRVAHASAPLVTVDGRVLVARGRAGGRDGDELSIDEIAPDGTARVVWRGRGALAHLAGAWRDQILVYVVRTDGASLLGVGLDSGRTRAIVPSLLPFARDFSVDAGSDAIVFAERDEARSDRWVVDRVDLVSGARTRLHTSPSQHLAPHVWPGGAIAIAGDDGGLHLLGAAGRAPAGAGVDVVRAISPDGGLAAAWHYPPGSAQPEVLILDAAARVRAHVAQPATRLEIAGFGAGTP